MLPARGTSCGGHAGSARTNKIPHPVCRDVARPPSRFRAALACGKLAPMSDTFLHRSVDEIATKIAVAVPAAAGMPVVVHVGGEMFGCTNVGIEVPKARRSAREAA